MRKFLKFISSRFAVLALLLTGELIFLIVISVYFAAFSQYGFIFFLVCWIINIPFLIFIANSKANTSFKLGWAMVVSIVPGGGALLYFLFANKRDTKTQRKKLAPYHDYLLEMNSNTEVLDSLKDIDMDAYIQSSYIFNKSGSIPYKNTYVKYYELGQYAWTDLIKELKKAKHFIFIEYFIIEEGKFFNSILEVLKEKVKEGVEVRLMYDDFGSMSKVGFFYIKQLKSFGINAVVFQRYKPFLDIKMNNRDHRKILIIDGHTSFTGGINLADEYVNEVERFGEWKDGGILIKGEATEGMTALFLSLWDNYHKIKEDFSNYLYDVYKDEMEEVPFSGIVQPYGDIPFDYESVGENVYLNLINRAKKYIYISTPYLILDSSLMYALKNAAKSGIDVRIVLPSIPDKKIVYEVTKSYAYELKKSGVKIYYYKPGFNHLKLILVDDMYASIGSINFDLRSFYLNYENAVFLYKTDSINNFKEDFNYMFDNSILEDQNKKVSVFRRIFWGIISCFSPML